MALVLADRVKETTTSTGTGNITLDGASTGYQSFAVVGNGNTTYYTIAAQAGTEWEVGIGTYTLSGTVLTRTTVLSNSSGTQPSALNFSAGTKDVFVTYPSGKSVNLDASGNVSALGTIASGAWQATTIGINYGGTGQTTQQAALTALSGTQASGQYLRSNGTNTLLSAIQVADVPTLNQNTTGSAATLTTGRTIAITGDLAYTSPSFDGSANVTAAGTLATVNANVGSFTNATLTVNGKGLITAASSGTAPVTSVTATSPVASTGGTTPVISMPAATTTVSGYLTSTDWNTFNGKGSGTVTSVSALTLGTTGTDLSSTVANSTTTPVITLNVPTASATNRGALSSADWTTFNNKGSGTVTSVSGTAGRITSTGGATPVLDLTSGIATAGTTGSASLIPVVTIDTYGRVTSITTAANPQGTVTSVTGTAPVVSSGGATPAISMAAATTSVSGYLTSTDWNTFNGKGSGTVTSVAATVPSFLSVSGSPITTSGTLAITLSGTALPVVNGGTGVTTSTGSGNVVLSTSPSLTTPVLGTPTSGTLSNCTVDGTDAVGFRNVPVNSQSAAYTLVLADSGKTILHPSGDANARTFTIPSNASVAYPIGTVVTFINMTSQVVTIAINTDTMYLSSAGTTGSRSLAQYGSATALKITSTDWLISGSGLT